MDDCSEIVRNTCCTCLSRDRKLSQLCRVYDGVNNLYMLLSHDSEAYREGFFKESASLFICWECRATMCRLTRFREQACIAQRQLSCIADGETGVSTSQEMKTLKCLSQLSRCIPPCVSIISKMSMDDSVNFIDCDLNIDIKSESDEDIPPSETNIKDEEAHVINNEVKKECKVKKEELCNSTARMICQEIVEGKDNQKIKNLHGRRKDNEKIKKLHGRRKANQKSKSLVIDNKYLCTECNQYFDTKNQKWKHMQRNHREGYKCSTCDKSFAFKNNLVRHLLLHKEPPARTECPICQKSVRLDLLKVHSQIHSSREKHKCVECAKSFVSRASYEHHLKYTTAHSAAAVLKYKCTVCDKGYRSRGELQDHVNYQHKGKTRHKCPICDKALASRRCVTRHVRRAHDGIKESARDKICQQCGKAFRDAKGLREHELIHSGERPLSCELCGATFRQSASLYTHRKRVHKIYPQTKQLQLVE